MLNSDEVNKVFRKAAEWASHSWPGVVEKDDLAQELWLWYLTRPSVRAKFEEMDYRGRLQVATKHAHRLTAELRNANARFSNQVRYSVDDIRDALSGRSRWPEIADDVAQGLAALTRRNAAYVEAIEQFVSDNRPSDNAYRMRLTRAIEALTDETNAVVRQLFDGGIPTRAVTEDEYRAGDGYRTLSDGPGTKRRAFPRDVNSSKNIFDSEFNGIPGIDMYRSWVEPDLYPQERPARIENWSEYDREDFGNG